MYQILIVSSEIDTLSDFSTGLKESEDVEIYSVKNCKNALPEIRKGKFDLMVVDELLTDTTGLECIEKSIMVDAFLNTAAVSSLSKKEFHEKSEGFGVLMQVPVKPVAEDGKRVVEYLKGILKRSRR